VVGETVPQEMLRRGAQLGRYEIRQMLGQGGMGQVYRAWDMVLQRDVAVKVLGTPDRELLQRFAREAEAISQLENANVVTIHDFQADPVQPYIVMEYLQGEDLAARLRRVPMTVGEAVDTALGVCSAVHACHSLGIIHRDLKPGNVFLHRTVEFGVVVKVLDFGVAMLRQDVFEEITQPGHVVGTPRYLSPEQVAHKEADAKSDQYAIGHLLYTMLAGRSPFAKQHGPQLIKAILNSEYPRLLDVCPVLPPGLADIVEKTLSAAPGLRFPSVLALGRAIMRHSTDEDRIPPALLAAAGERELPIDSHEDYSNTNLDVRLAEPGEGRKASGIVGISRAAAAAAETLEGDDPRPALGQKVVPIAPFQVMPVVSTTARLPTATAIDLSFGGGARMPVTVEKTADLNLWSKRLATAPEPPPPPVRPRGVGDARSRPPALLGIGRNKMLAIAVVLLLAAIVAVLVVLALRPSEIRVVGRSIRRAIPSAVAQNGFSPAASSFGPVESSAPASRSRHEAGWPFVGGRAPRDS
jgi:hypothetical protein